MPLVSIEQLQREIPGGTGTYVRGLMRGLRELGQPFVAYKAAGHIPGHPDGVGSAGATQVVSSRLPERLMTLAWSKGVPLRLDRSRFSLFHATSPAFPVIKGGPFAVTIHDMVWQEVPEAFSDRARRWHEKRVQSACDQADLILTPSFEVKEKLTSRGVSPSRLVVFREGVDHLVPPDVSSAKSLLNGCGIDGEFLLSVGTLEPRKNLARIIEAYALLRSAQSAAPPLVIVGPRGWGDVVSKVGDAQGVHLVGEVSAPVLSALYASCLLFVSVPLAEGFGLPQVEAMSMGAPVITSAVPSIQSTHTQAASASSVDVDHAKVVDPLDVSQISQALAEVLDDAGLRTKLIAAGRAYCAELTWANTARAHIDAWKAIA